MQNTKRVSRTLLICVLAFAFGWSNPANAAEQELNDFFLDEVVVTATKTPISAFKANANISVVTRNEIEKNHYTTVADALRDVPGVTIANYGASGETYTSNSLSLNGSSNVVVLIDGVRANINSSAGTYGKLALTEMSNMDFIERIEVLKSSASALYGADAQGGVINIITRKPQEGESKTSLRITGGSFDKEQYNLLHTGGADGFYWTIAGQKKSSGDFKDGRGNTTPEGINSTTTTKLGKKFDDKSEVIFNYQAYHSDNLKPEGGNNQLKRTSLGKKDNDKLSIVFNHKFSDQTSNQFSFFRNTNKLDDNYEKPLRFGSHWIMDLETIGFQDQVTHQIGDDHTLIGGFELYQDKINKYSTENTYGSGVAYGDKMLTNRAFYLQDEWRFAPEWQVTTGIRFDNHSVYGNHSTPSLTLGYTPNEKVSAFIGYREYYVAPNQGQIYSPQYGMPGGNMNLQP